MGTRISINITEVENGYIIEDQSLERHIQRRVHVALDVAGLSAVVRDMASRANTQQHKYSESQTILREKKDRDI